MPSVTWVEPIMTWDGRGLDAIAQPALIGFDSDRFMTDFLEAMAVTAQDHDETGADLPGTYLDERVLENHREKGDGAWKLYQPLHGRYYLIAGALVCRQLGLPDKAVALSDGERTTFVIRRVEGGRELAWVEGEGWTPVEHPCDLYRGDEGAGPQRQPPVEEQLPLHAVAADTAAGTGAAETGARAEPSLQPRRRQVYYGYIPVGSRKKYTAADGPTTLEGETSDAAIAIQKYHEAQQEGRPNQPDYRLTEYVQRVAGPWADLITSVSSGTLHKVLDEGRIQQASLYVLLDLGDFLKRALSPVWSALKAGEDASLTEVSAFQNLYDRLEEIHVQIGENGTWSSLATELPKLEEFLGLVNGESVEERPDVYDVSSPREPEDEQEPPVDDENQLDPIPHAEDYFDPSLGGGSKLVDLVKDALAEEDPAMDLANAGQRLRMLRAQVPPPAPPEDGEYRYRIRLVYRYDPACCPILSAPSHKFTLAPLFDPEAPARQVKIELPSIKMEDMRKLTHGVAMQMTPELRNVMNRIHKNVVDEGLAPGPVLELGMICTFSIPIITLVAFIVMFIFLIALNFIFWWLPFLKICFPIPQQE